MMRFELRWAQHLLSAFAPPASGSSKALTPAPSEVDYLSVLARMRCMSSPLAALGLRAAVWIAALAPLWLWGKLLTVSSLAHERRPELLRQLLGHNSFAVRELTLLLKLCAAMALLGTPSVRARSGYDPLDAGREAGGLRARLPIVVAHSSAPPPPTPALEGAATPSEVPPP